MRCQLRLEDISLSVKLGYSEEERSSPQRVLVQVTFQFASVPLGCTTDGLDDTLCYAMLTDKLQKFCDTRSFKLIEALGYQLYRFLKEKIIVIYPEEITVFLRVTKHPPLSTLTQASFSISD
jgi:dihydroneopterin aldolase